MTQADSVHSTPPLNTSAIGARFRWFMNHPVELVAVLTLCSGSLLLHFLIAVMP